MMKVLMKAFSAVVFRKKYLHLLCFKVFILVCIPQKEGENHPAEQGLEEFSARPGKQTLQLKAQKFFSFSWFLGCSGWLLTKGN